MPRSRGWVALICGALASVPSQLAAQVAAVPPVAVARELVKAGKVDSARALLRQVVDSQSTASAGERVEAWVLAGIVEYYYGSDSAVTDAFRHALALSPEAQVQLPDPALQQRFERLRPPPPKPIAAALDSVIDCVPRCKHDVEAPQLRSPLGPTGTATSAGEFSSSRVYVVALAVVDTLGRVESVEVVSATAPPSFTESFVSQLKQSSYRPARLHGRPVRVRIEVRLEVRGERVR